MGEKYLDYTHSRWYTHLVEGNNLRADFWWTMMGIGFWLWGNQVYEGDE